MNINIAHSNRIVNILMNISNLFRRKPPSKSPPARPSIRELDLHVKYRRKNKTMSTATLNWTNPTTRVDGSVFTSSDIAAINIFDGSVMIGSQPGAGTSFTTGTLTVGDHVFTVVVQDTAGHLSDASNAATVTVPATQANPSPATNLTATLNA